MGRSDLGERCIRFIENLTLCDDYAGQPFRLQDWQKDLIRTLFGTIRKDGLRRYKKAFWAFGRKSGKTTLIAGIVLFLLFGTGKKEQKIYSASGDRAQAGLVFQAAAKMVKADPYLSRKCLIYEGNIKKIVVPTNGNVYEALSSDAPTKHGLNPSVVIFDELHVFPDNRLHDALVTGFGARLDPLTIYITTAGENKLSLCYQMWQYAKGVLEGSIKDETFYPVLYEADPSDDWTLESTWAKALPGLGTFTNIETIRTECEKAKLNASYEVTFKQYYLNLWVDDLVKLWITGDAWDSCQAEIDWSDYEGRPCYGGLDLSSSKDLTAFILLFPNENGSYDVKPHFWAPGKSARQKQQEDGAPYLEWARDNHITMSDQDTINYDSVLEEIVALSQRFDIKAIAYDGWQANYLAEKLEDAGLEMLKYGQSFSYMNAPCRHLEYLIPNGKIRHDGNPVLRWCATNTVLQIKDEIVRPSKGKSKNRIDGLVATVMALGVAMDGANLQPEVVTDASHYFTVLNYV